MKRIRIVIIAALLSAPASAPAQTASPRSFAGGTPDRMPFDIPYGEPIRLARARELLAAAEAVAGRRGWKEAIAVVDPAGELVAFGRMDDTQYSAVTIAQNKARTAARFRRDTRIFYDRYESGHPDAATLDPQLTASPGGLPLVENGRLIGAIGCSGGTGDQDDLVCHAALALLR